METRSNCFTGSGLRWPTIPRIRRGRRSSPGVSWGAATKKMIGALVLGVAGFGLIWVGVSHVRR
jgi:hypothetical protein